MSCIEEKEACEFCRLYNESKKRNRKFANQMGKDGMRIRHTYRIALIVDTYRIWCHNRGGRTTHRPMKLRYCPMCGKKL